MRNLIIAALLVCTGTASAAAADTEVPITSVTSPATFAAALNAHPATPEDDENLMDALAEANQRLPQSIEVFARVMETDARHLAVQLVWVGPLNYSPLNGESYSNIPLIRMTRN